MDTRAKPVPTSLPEQAGVYLFKDAQGVIVYIGKAKNIKKRVQSYFKPQHTDWKLAALMTEYDHLDYVITKTEMEAMLLEADLIKEHQPKYNVLLKDGQPFIYLLFTKPRASRSTHSKQTAHQTLPTLKIVRSKRQRGTYFGPFLQKSHARKVYQFLMHTFRLTICNKRLENGCLDYHLGKCAGTCKPTFQQDEYLLRLQLAQDALARNHTRFLKRLQEQIATYNAQFSFEKSKKLHTYVENLHVIFDTIKAHYSYERYQDMVHAACAPTISLVGEIHPNEKTAETASDRTAHHELAAGLQHLAGTSGLIRTIDCFDISHFQGQYIVGSCVRFTDGVPEKNKFRRFKIKTLSNQNDCAALQEIVARRYRDADDYPDLVLIDGGKGQLNAVAHLIPEPTVCLSLAKREEELFGTNHKKRILLHPKDPVGKTLLAIRDYAHHFAIQYHRTRRHKQAHGS